MMEDFEKDLKKHFEGRKIQPSENAWSRMETLLNEEETIHKKKQKTYFYLIPIAASLVLFFGIWLSKEKSEVPVLDTKTRESFVVNDVTEEEKKADSKNENILASDSSKQEKIKENEEKIFRNHIIKITKELTPFKEEKTETVAVTANLNEKSSIKENEHVVAELVKKSDVEIKVNARKLLQSAEIERQVENTLTDGQNFWKKVKEINTVVEHKNK